MKINLLAFGLALLLCPQLFAQSFRAATITRVNGEELPGLVNYEGWLHSPGFITFKMSADEKVETYNAKDLRSFCVNGVDEYMSYTGPVSVSKFEGSEIPYVRDSTVKDVSVFLRVVSKGTQVSLLSYRDGGKTCYFVAEKNGQPIELKFYRYYDSDDRMVTSAPFKAIIISLLEKYRGADELWFKEVGMADYKLSTLQYLVKLINNDQSKEISTFGYRFFIGAGAMYQRSSFTGLKEFKFQSQSATVPVFSIGYDFFNNRFTQRTIFRLEASAWQTAPTFDGVYSYYHYKAIVISLKPQVVHNLVNNSKLKFFIGAGVGINVPLQSYNGLTATESGVILSNGLAIQTKGSSYKSLQAGETLHNPYGKLAVFVTPEVKTGLAFNKYFELNLSASIISSQLLEPHLNSGIGIYSLGLNYYLGGRY